MIDNLMILYFCKEIFFIICDDKISLFFLLEIFLVLLRFMDDFVLNMCLIWRYLMVGS